MNELIKTTTAIATCQDGQVAPQIMMMCRAVTPQFYKNLSDADIKAEKLSIELLTSGIQQECLAEMCRLAVLNYPRVRSENSKSYFDINYILTFYKQVFNKMYCDDVVIPRKSQCIDSVYDDLTHIIKEQYKTPNGDVLTVQEIIEPLEGTTRFYSSKRMSMLFTNYGEGWENDIEI